MSCKNKNINLIGYLDGELTPEQKQKVESHLASCQDCQNLLYTLKQTYGIIEQEKEQYQANPYLANKIWNKLQDNSNRVAAPIIPLRRTAIASIAAAGIAFGIAIGSLLNSSLTNVNDASSNEWTQLADEYFPSDVFSPYEDLLDNN